MPGDLREYDVLSKTVGFRRRLEQAKRELERVVTLHQRWVVSTSWGKDSCALAGLICETLGTGFDAVHLKSPYELPGYERVIEWFSARCVIHTVSTTRTLQEYVGWLRLHGLAYEREKLRAAGKKRKTDEIVSWTKDNGYTLQLLGMRAAESAGRRKCFSVHGLSYMSHGLSVSNPIGWWSTKDVWAYLVSRDIPWHPLYDCETHGTTREGLRNIGWLTVSGGPRIPWLRRHYPDQYRMLVEAFPQVRLIG